jgi:hypothetical protein
MADEATTVFDKLSVEDQEQAAKDAKRAAIMAKVCWC